MGVKDEIEFRKAEEDGVVEAYQAYLEKYPQGRPLLSCLPSEYTSDPIPQGGFTVGRSDWLQLYFAGISIHRLLVGRMGFGQVCFDPDKFFATNWAWCFFTHFYTTCNTGSLLL